MNSGVSGLEDVGVYGQIVSGFRFESTPTIVRAKKEYLAVPRYGGCSMVGSNQTVTYQIHVMIAWLPMTDWDPG